MVLTELLILYTARKLLSVYGERSDSAFFAFLPYSGHDLILEDCLSATSNRLSALNGESAVAEALGEDTINARSAFLIGKLDKRPMMDLSMFFYEGEDGKERRLAFPYQDFLEFEDAEPSLGRLALARNVYSTLLKPDGIDNVLVALPHDESENHHLATLLPRVQRNMGKLFYSEQVGKSPLLIAGSLGEDGEISSVELRPFPFGLRTLEDDIVNRLLQG